MDDLRLLEIFLRPIRLCANYTPKLGGGEKVDAAGFRALYGRDTFYSLIGLDDEMMFAAHRAAGGLTSIYRQIGVGSERLFRQIASDSLALDLPRLDWSYEYESSRGKIGVHKLDCRVRFEDLNADSRGRFEQWLEMAKKLISTGQDGKFRPDGIVFEVRQGYKSADSKRQNADIRYAARANQDELLPVVFLMSDQINRAIVERYRRNGLLITTGVIGSDPCVSSFGLVKCLFEFDLLEFFKRHHESIRSEVHSVIKTLLSAT